MLSGIAIFTNFSWPEYQTRELFLPGLYPHGMDEQYDSGRRDSAPVVTKRLLSATSQSDTNAVMPG